MVGRSRDVATPAELGYDCRPDPDDAPEVPPKDVRHDLETVDDHDGPPVERCRHCERVAHYGAIDPFTACPERSDDEPKPDVDADPESIPRP